MARTLRAKAPDSSKTTRPKIIVFGPPGVRKTWVSLEFPRVYYIDTEGGASLPAYQEKLAKSDGVYFGKDEGSQDFKTVIEEIITLATTEHPFLTLVIDSFSKLYNLCAAAAEETVGNDFGKDKREAQKPTRQLMSWLERLDMNVVLICHEKEKWRKQGQQLYSDGQTFDGWEKMEYDLHLCIRVQRAGAQVTKSRISGFKDGEKFPWTFADVEKRCEEGIMLRPAKQVVIADVKDVAEIQRLLSVVRPAPEWQEKAFAKAGVSSWGEMDRDKALACIGYLRGLIKSENDE